MGTAPCRGPGAPLSPRSLGHTHRLQEAQGAHVVPLSAQDLVEDTEAKAQLALRLPGGRARAGAGCSGAGGPGVRVGTIPSPVAAGIAAAGYLHSSEAARRRLLPPHGDRAERRLKRPSAPSRRGAPAGRTQRRAQRMELQAGWSEGLGAEAKRGGWPRGGRRRPSGLPDGGPQCSRRPGSVCQVPRRAEPQRRAAAFCSDVGSSARPERGLSGRSGGSPPEGTPRSSEASAPIPRWDAWRPHPLRGLRHSHPVHATLSAHRHTHAGPAATAAAPTE